MIADNYTPVKTLGNGVTTEFSFGFALIAEANIRVYLEDVETGVQTLQTLGSDYTVEFDDDTPGGIVTFADAPSDDYYVVIGRDIPKSQAVPLTTSAGFQAKVVEAMVDKAVGGVQDIKEEVKRTLKTKIGGTTDLTVAEPDPGKGLKWNDAGDGVENTVLDADEAAIAAAASAAAALVSQNAAAASAATASTKASEAAASKTNAETAETNAETAETNAETAETNAEAAQVAAESARDTAVTAKDDAVTAKNAAQAAQTAAETAETNAETAETNAETAETNAETAEVNAETAQAAAETARDQAAAYAASAAGIPIATAGGTVDAITADYTPDMTLSNLAICSFVAGGANTSTTPTFAPDGLTPHTITKKGGQALAAGDIPGAGAVCIVEYNLANTRWELLNPATVDSKTGIFSISKNDASGNVSYTGIGFKPRAVDFWFGEDGIFVGSGSDDGTIHFSQTVYFTPGQDISTVYSIILYDSPITSYKTGYIVSMDADGFTIAWTRVNTPTGTATVGYRAYK